MRKMWVALATHGEGASAPLGLIRIDLKSMRRVHYNSPAIISDIVGYGDRLYLATNDGVTVVSPDGKLEPYFVDIDVNGSFQLQH
jgi:hypothetical protein